MPVWAAADKACGPYVASKITNYKSGGADITSYLKYDCVSDSANWKTAMTPLEWAISGLGVCPGNYDAVKVLLDKKPELANSLTYDKTGTMLAASISNCCDGENESKCGKNRQDEITQLLIDKGADVDAVSELSPGNAPKQKRTLLDLVRAHQQYNDTCKRSAGKTTCAQIEKKLIAAGAKTYAELNGETSSAPVSKKPEAKKPAADTPVKGKEEKPADTEKSVKKKDDNSPRCIKGRIATPKNQLEVISGVNVSLKSNPNKKVQTNTKGEFELCGVQDGDGFIVEKEGWMSGKGPEVVSVSPKIEDYVDTDNFLDVRINPWFLEKDVTISVYFSDIPDCKVSNAVMAIGTRQDPVNSLDGCDMKSRTLEMDENDDWKLDCFYPGIELGWERILPMVPDETYGFTQYSQHPSWSEQQLKPDGKNKYILQGGRLFEAENLKSLLEDRVKNGHLTQEQADEYWKKALKNCPDAKPGAKEDKTDETSSKVDDAKKAYDDAKATEQSTANKMLGGVSMAATGIGGMQLAQGLAEKSADEAADKDMQAYLATFKCKVSDKSYTGGTMGIDVGGTNSLITLYQEYVDLAADLKARKEALGQKPGIESEVVLNKAEMGLYDDVGHGIENGTYASLYRASRGNENDKNKLAEQKESSANRVKGGAIAAGGGALGGVVGNEVMNGGDSKKADEPNVVCYNQGRDTVVSCSSPYRSFCIIQGKAANVYTELDCGTMTVKGGQAIH